MHLKVRVRGAAFSVHQNAVSGVLVVAHGVPHEAQPSVPLDDSVDVAAPHAAVSQHWLVVPPHLSVVLGFVDGVIVLSCEGDLVWSAGDVG